MKQDNKTKQTTSRWRRLKPCPFTLDKAEVIDYRDINKLQRYVSERGKILPRRTTGVTARYQRMLARSIKRARHAGLLASTIN